MGVSCGMVGREMNIVCILTGLGTVIEWVGVAWLHGCFALLCATK